MEKQAVFTVADEHSYWIMDIFPEAGHHVEKIEQHNKIIFHE